MLTKGNKLHHRKNYDKNGILTHFDHLWVILKFCSVSLSICSSIYSTYVYSIYVIYVDVYNM